MSDAGPRVSVQQVHDAVAARDMDGAMALAETAYRQGIHDPLVLNLLAYKLELEDRLDAALEVLDRARQASPDDPFIWNSIGVCHSKADRPSAALDAFEAALRLNPNFAHAHNGAGLALAALGDMETAKRAQQTAAELDPNFAEPLGALASMAAEEGEWAAARDYAARALALEENQPAAAMSLARTEIEEKDFAGAEARLARLIAGGRLTKLHLAGALNFRGDALDAMGRSEEAMAAWIAGNRELRQVQVPALDAPEMGLDTAERLIGYFGAAPRAAWRGPAETGRPGEEIGHVLLTGFARSGTTLLEQILASHGDIVALEEKATIDDTILEFFQDNAGLDKLAGLDEEGLRPWRELYWKRVRDLGVEPRGKVFVDKLPMHTIYLPAFAKLFPRCKVIMARRDPRDVVVSCFKNRFRPNRLVIEFSDLERTAKLYAATMQLGEMYSGFLDQAVYVHQHEQMVADLEASTRALCDFMGVPWDANMLNFVETANRRDIRTPSAGQVRQGLNASGVAAWRKYGSAIDPIKPILAPWVERFGYDAD